MVLFWANEARYVDQVNYHCDDNMETENVG